MAFARRAARLAEGLKSRRGIEAHRAAKELALPGAYVKDAEVESEAAHLMLRWCYSVARFCELAAERRACRIERRTDRLREKREKEQAEYEIRRPAHREIGKAEADGFVARQLAWESKVEAKRAVRKEVMEEAMLADLRDTCVHG